ncbi:MAG TPA: D-alanyl-D-alanine carboxypeptidase family protein [Planococcus sp. (in: firmicutes)]|nr:D-alanyl-D-alanine carboxypeptidase family protein [Planococcus sp. (in: firmicutes)]
MKSRYSYKQDKKNSYIKWGAGGLLAALLIAGTWLYANGWDVDRSLSALERQQAEETDSQEPVAEKPEEPGVEQPVTPTAEEDPSAKNPPAEEPKTEDPAPDEPQAEEPAEQQQADATSYQEGLKLPAKPTYIKNILLANKQHPLPQNYAPGENKEARAAFEAMKKDAQAAGINLNAFSTYREFARQKQLYEGYVAKDGAKAADRYSARPGFSEHQTGLAFDIGEAGQEQHWASASFGATKGGKWLKANAHKYGFILRYPEGSEQITGYMHESWHFRFVGNAVAKEIFAKGITLEQYLGVQ